MDVVNNFITVFLVAAITAVLITAAWKFLNWAWFTPKKLEKKLKAQGLHGTPYNFLFGDFKELAETAKEATSKPMNLYDDDLAPRVIPIFDKIIKRYGKNSYVWLGPNPTVILMEPDLIKDVTQKNFNYVKVPQNPLARLLMKGILIMEGEEWVKHRKIINTAFHSEKLKNMVPAFCVCTSEMLTKWEEIVSSKSSSEVDVWPYLQTLTGDVISRTAFGSNYEEGRRIFELQREQAQHYIDVVTSLYIPGWRFFPSKKNRRMKEISRVVNSSIESIINARLKERKAGEACGDDLLGILLETNFKEIDQNGSKDFGLSIREVIEECKLFYFAGQETTSVLLVWTLILLSRHPEWQNRAREEVLKTFGTNKPDLDGLNHLKIVTMILYEVLRLYTPVSALIRKTDEEIKLGDLMLPEGVFLLLPTVLLHHDPELWGADAKEFKPERFAEGVSNATKGQLSFFPFSWGPRICVGQQFAMMEAKIALAMILQHFSFEISPSYSHAPRSVVTIQPTLGAQLILHKL